jgi:hypothetical protein
VEKEMSYSEDDSEDDSDDEENESLMKIKEKINKRKLKAIENLKKSETSTENNDQKKN